jgi:hypothetical protein
LLGTSPARSTPSVMSIVFSTSTASDSCGITSAYEARHVKAREPRSGKQVDQPGLIRGRDPLRLVWNPSPTITRSTGMPGRYGRGARVSTYPSRNLLSPWGEMIRADIC